MSRMSRMVGFLVVIGVLILVRYLLVPKRAIAPVPNISASPSPTPAANPADPNGMVELTYPIAEQKISSPLKLTGRAKGNWFFEGSFPVVLTDWDGMIIAQTAATTTENWMTTDWVPFSATLEFEKPSYGERGSLILRKDNPSGLPQNDAAYEITIFFE